LIAAQRAAGDAPCATLKEQLRPSALRLAVPAAKAALVALMQTTSNAAAAISIINFMASLAISGVHPFISPKARYRSREIGPVFA
jgi:ABC-type arginine/histidine transport system permease subunit